MRGAASATADRAAFYFDARRIAAVGIRTAQWFANSGSKPASLLNIESDYFGFYQPTPSNTLASAISPAQAKPA